MTAIAHRRLQISKAENRNEETMKSAYELAMERLKEADRQGYGEQYHPVVLKVIDPQ